MLERERMHLECGGVFFPIDSQIIEIDDASLDSRDSDLVDTGV